VPKREGGPINRFLLISTIFSTHQLEYLNMSARQRERPLTGRSNLSSSSSARGGGGGGGGEGVAGRGFGGERGRGSDVENANPQKPQTSYSSRSGATQSKSGLDSSDTNFINTARKIEINNPLFIHTPFNPEEIMPSVEISRPPILPKNRYATVYLEEEPVRKGKPYTPKEWVEKLQKPTIGETIDMASFKDENLRTELAREFIDRNKHRLWKFNLDYIGMQPKEVYDNLMTTEGLISKLQTYSRKEAVLNLGSSDKIKKNLTDEGYNSLGEIRNDFALNSLTTSRDVRREKINRILAPTPETRTIRTNTRGFRHTAEYGNFSTFTSYMNLNASTSLNR
jgi:hypothetical protein